MQIPGPAQVQFVSPPFAYPSGAWISPNGQNNGSVTPVTGTLYIFGFICPSACNFTQLGMQIVGSPSSDSIIRIGAWAQGSGFSPGSLIADTGAQAITTNGTKNYPAAGSFNAGLNFLGFAYTVSTTPGAIEISTQGILGQPSLGFTFYGTLATPSIAQGNDGSVFTQTGVTGALPNPAVATWVGNSNAPNRPATIFFRVA